MPRSELGRISSYISHEYGRIRSSDFKFNSDLYGEYDNAPPSIFAQDETDGEQPTSKASYYGKKVLLVCATGFALLFRLMSIIFTGALVFIGIYYIKGCSCQPFIPIYMIVTGFLLCALIFYAIYQSCQTPSESEDPDGPQNIIRYLKDLLTLFAFAWFIAGSATVYKIYTKVNFSNVTADCYCQPVLYKSTFWSITGFYLVLATVLAIGMIGMFIKYIASCCQGKQY